MRIRESLRSSFKSLFHNKLRSFLTMLGIIIGIFSVIMLTSIGEGIKNQITYQVESLGANLLYVFPGEVEIRPRKGESKLGVKGDPFAQIKNTLTYDDALLLKNKKNVASVTVIYTGIDKLNKLNIYVSTTGTDEDYNKIKQFKFKYGRFITKEERVDKARVAVIGHQANKEIFQGGNSIGKTFKLNDRDYKVVGVLDYKKPENMGPGSEDINVNIYLPVTEMVERSKDKNVSQIIVQASSAEVIPEVEKTIEKTLLKIHKDVEFSVIKQQDMLEAIKNILGILTTGLGGIAAISLLVGGIGIMNIMLVSVAERTREIGVRKAIGASRRDIMVQFLIESIFLSVLGGILGVLGGIAGSRVLPSLLPEIKTAVSIPALIIALAFAFLVGVFFGVYPATKAAKLDPIESLRSE